MVIICIVACSKKKKSDLQLAEDRVQKAKAFDKVSPYSEDGPGHKDVLGEKEMANLANLGHELDGNEYGSIPAHSVVLPPRPEYE